MLIHTTVLTSTELQSAIIRDVLVVAPDTTVMDVIVKMSGIRATCSADRNTYSPSDDVYIETRSSCVLIVEDNQLIGIFTERDVVRLGSQQRSLHDLKIHQVMSHPVITLRESAFQDIFLAINLIQQHRIRHLPIVDERDRVVGLLTHESLRQTLRPVDLLRLRLVTEVMNSEVICADPQTSMLAIAHLMAKHRISSVVIVQEGMANHSQSDQIPIGIVTERDIVQFQALNLDMETCLVKAVMSTPIFTVKPHDSLWMVQQIMEQRRISRVAVTGSQGELLSIVTQSSLLQILNPLELYKFAEVLEQKILRLEVEKVELLENRMIELAQEVEERTTTLRAKTDRERLIAQIANRIRTSLNLEDILSACVAEVRDFLRCDRVSVYQFQPDWSGVIVSESVGDSWVRSLGSCIKDSCFQEQNTTLYEYGRAIAVDNIYCMGYTDCHIKLLEQYQVKSNLVVPILVSGHLWGLLIGHQCENYRSWHIDDVTLLDEMGVQLAIAIQQATAYQQAQAELAERRKTEVWLRESEQRLEQLNQELEARVEQRTAELQERETQLQDFFDNANDLIQSVLLEDGSFEYVNRAWRQILEYSEAEVQELTIFDVLHPSCQKDYYEAIAQMQAGVISTVERVELTFITKDRREVIVEGSINCRYEGDRASLTKASRPVATRAIFRDITDRKQVEEALHQSQQFLQTVLDTFPLSVFWKDRESVFLGCNQKFAQNLGLQSSLTEIIGKTDFDLSVTEAEANAYRNDDQQVMESGNAKLGIEETLTRLDGVQIWLETNKIPLRDLDGNVVGVVGTFQDITARKQAEARLTESNQQLAISNEQLARATRLKDEFLANMSHELRTPLNAILGMTEGIQEEVFGIINEQQQKALQTIERSGNHLLELINDILDLAKIEAGQVELDCVSTAINPLCQSSLAFIKQQALKKHLQLHVNIPPYLPDLILDERRIRQVLINLLNNAVKFTPEGGSITLEVTLARSSSDDTKTLMRFAVIDTGIGIALEDLQKLFQPFIQVDSALNRQYQGTGLGLSLVKRIVELHGGSVGVSSQVGIGSRFTVDLPCPELLFPLPKPLPSLTYEVGSPEEKATKDSPLILIVEDNEANIITISSYLKAKGYRLILANNGQEAIDLAISQQPDLILMDIQMPGMDGLEAMKHIRTNHKLVDIPIIALTALAMTGDREKCLEAGASHYLTKPVKLKQLAATIQQFLSI